MSNSGILPVINLNPSDLRKSSIGPTQSQWHHMTSGDASSSATWNAYPNDPNLIRYLKLGRRHTLGAAQNHMLIPPSDLGHLREASECSSQTSNGSAANVSATTSPHEVPLTLRSALASGHAESHSSQSGSSTLPRVAVLQPQIRARMGRRASDGGPYAAVFRLFLEKRMPQLSQINSRGSLYNSGTLSSASSVKQLLQERKSQEAQFGKLSTASKDMLLHKDQVMSKLALMYVNSILVLTLGEHVQGLGQLSCVCVCVCVCLCVCVCPSVRPSICLSVTALAASASVYRCNR